MIFGLFAEGTIDKKELTIFLYLQAKQNHTISYSELARFAGISVLTAKSAMEGLRDEGLIEYEQPKVGQAHFNYLVR